MAWEGWKLALQPERACSKQAAGKSARHTLTLEAFVGRAIQPAADF
jgi:hypothetical protein